MNMGGSRVEVSVITYRGAEYNRANRVTSGAERVAQLERSAELRQPEPFDVCRHYPLRLFVTRAPDSDCPTARLPGRTVTVMSVAEGRGL